MTPFTRLTPVLLALSLMAALPPVATHAADAPEQLLPAGDLWSDRGARAWRDDAGKLIRLDLNHVAIESSELAELENHPHLRELVLWGIQLDDDSLRYIADLRDLYHLNLRETRVTDAALEWIALLPSLEELNLRSTRITDEGLARLSGLINLRSLDLSDTSITHRGVRHLTRIMRLEELILDGTDFGDEGFDAINSMKELRKLSLWETPITDHGIARLGELLYLEDLDIRATETSDDAILGLRDRGLNLTLPSLSMLHVDGTLVTKEGVTDFRETLPSCYVEW